MAAHGTASPKLAGMKFLVEEVLGTGDKTTVMRIGDQNDLGKAYALKTIKREDAADDALIERARVSVEASTKLGHPAALKYHDFRIKKKLFVIVERAEVLMEYVNGVSLDKLGTPLEVAPGAVLFHELAAVLAHMHRRAVRHGDLKPAHVMLTRSGQVKVLGYGLNYVKDRGPRGTTQYMAPEQMNGNVIDEKTDLYNLGATMYQLLTGRPANVGGRAMGEAGKIPLPTALNSKIPSKLNNLIVACLQSNPHKRPEGAFNVEQDLKALLDEMKLDTDCLKGLTPAPKEA